LSTISNMQASQFLDKLKKLDQQDVNDLHGIGEVLVQNLHNFVNSNRFTKLKAKLEELESQEKGINIKPTKQEQIQGQLSGEIICITGTFTISRPNIKTQLEVQGAKVVDNITTKTTILLAGSEAGSKLIKAKKLGIKIVENLDELL
jgi:DNA ligase (NAD+)